ncbi:MAG: DUF3365 domain-containing protein, partial [Planctomycetales bacterium]|nr:DUF3365 domain-containing protein [Planctomycetales bacterium]
MSDRGWPIGLLAVCVTVGFLGVAGSSADDEAGNDGQAEIASLLGEAVDSQKLTVDVARERAQVMQEVYAATLEMLHQRYFHRDRSLLPARAMQDIFAEIEQRSQVQARWISASLPAMSNDHEPESDFEKRAAKEIAQGKAQLETRDGDTYRRAVAIPLEGGCLGCHAGR